MSKNLTVTVSKPCQENWNNFTPTDNGRFCMGCKKEVIDFTSWDSAQIKIYFNRSVAPVCGRFKAHQLTQKSASEKNSWVQAPMVALLLLLLSRPAVAQQVKPNTQQEQVDERKPVISTTDVIPKKMTITGVVRSAYDTLALPGVNVVRKGTTLGTVTDADGKFELVIDHPRPSEVLEFSFIGMISQARVVKAAATTSLEISLQEDEKVLGEVVVMGGTCSVPRLSPIRVWWWVKRGFRRW